LHDATLIDNLGGPEANREQIMGTTEKLDIESISQEYFAAWEACDPDRIAQLHSPDSRYQLHAGGEPAEGRLAVRQAFAEVFRQWPGFRFETHRVLYGEEHWVLDWDLLATLQVEQDDHEVDKPVRRHCLDVATVDSQGLVSRKDTFVDVSQVNSLLAG
jgi:ketosteroid isomerase-like protein